MKIVIVGGVAGGATAAARLRRLDAKAEILIFERTGYISYANCGLPYYIGGVIEDREDLTLQTPESFWARFRIEARTHSDVLSVDRAAKTVRVRDLRDGREYTESYDKLILSPGAKAVRPDLPGIDLDQVFTLRTVEDTFRIRDFLDANKPRRAVVIGGGFIGLEMTENLLHAGVETTLIQRGAHVMPPLDPDMASEVHAYLRKKGVDLRLNTSFTGFEAAENGIRVLLENDCAIEADLAILSIGVAPDSALAREVGLPLGAKGSIIVDEHMRTADPDIYAVGDAVEIRRLVLNRPALVSLAGPANKQGRIAADNICGRQSSFKGALGSSVLKLFDMTIASTGLNETMARAAGIDCDKVVTFSANHATYYPGARNMTIKTVFDPKSGQILGAQIIGFDGADKRIDVLATAIQAGMTGADLAELDLAYAPPYSSAKDPVNMAGFVIENIRGGLVKQFHWDEIAGLDSAKVTLLDVRTEEEYARGCIPGFINIPLDSLRERIQELDPAKPVYVHCYSGLRSYVACRILSGHGFDCFNLSGGYRFYDQNMRDAAFDGDPRHPCGVRI